MAGVVSEITNNKKKQKMINNIMKLSEPQSNCLDKLVSLMPALGDDKFPVILSVVSGLIQS